MEIPSNFSSPILETAKSTLTLDKLQTGQSTQAKIIQLLPNKTDIIIRLGNQTLQAKTSVPVTVGETINVLVEKTASELILKVKPPIQQASIIDASLRRLIPKQTPVNEFQHSLKRVFTSINQQTLLTTSPTASSHAQELTSQSMQIKRLAVNILQSLPDQKKLASSEGFKSALQKSGMFLEPKLRQALLENNATLNTTTHVIKKNLTLGQNPLLPINQAPIGFTQVDLKSNLIKLIQLLKAWPKATVNTPQPTGQNPLPIPIKSPASIAQTINPALLLENQIKELINKTEGSVAKITLNQLASSHTENTGNRQTWQVEIPFLNHHASESVFLKIEQEDSPTTQDKDVEQKWTVSLEMNPPKLGLIKNKLSINNQQIDANFWAESPETKNLIQRHLSLFKEQLTRANLQPERIQVSNGPGPVIQPVKPSTSILSEKA